MLAVAACANNLQRRRYSKPIFGVGMGETGTVKEKGEQAWENDVWRAVSGVGDSW